MYLVAPFGGKYLGVSNLIIEGKLSEYYVNLGIENLEFWYRLTLSSFKSYITDSSVQLEKIIKPFQEIEKKRELEYETRYSADSLWGNYIPIDLNDCITQLDKLCSDSLKQMIRLNKIRLLNFDVGRWVRNRWKLWTGSRLSKYLNGIGITGAEAMSGYILDEYYKYLNRIYSKQ